MAEQVRQDLELKHYRVFGFSDEPWKLGEQAPLPRPEPINLRVQFMQDRRLRQIALSLKGEFWPTMMVEKVGFQFLPSPG